MNIYPLVLVTSYFSEQVYGVIQGDDTSGKKWLALLLHSNGGFCSGTVYSESLIITAAHCNLWETNNWKAYPSLKNKKDAGNINNPGSAVLERYNHPGYIQKKEIYDISVWWVNSEANKRTEVILADSSEFNDISSMVYFLGWGSINVITQTEKNRKSFVPKFSERLQKGIVPLVKDDECNKIYQKNNGYFIPQIMFCTGEIGGGSAAGVGDSGSPIYRERNNKIVLLGVHSKSIGCGFERERDVNTRITEESIKNFIKHHIEIISPNKVKHGKIIKSIPEFIAPKHLILTNSNNRFEKAFQSDFYSSKSPKTQSPPVYGHGPPTPGKFLSPSENPDRSPLSSMSTGSSSSFSTFYYNELPVTPGRNLPGYPEIHEVTHFPKTPGRNLPDFRETTESPQLPLAYGMYSARPSEFHEINRLPKTPNRSTSPVLRSPNRNLQLQIYQHSYKSKKLNPNRLNPY